MSPESLTKKGRIERATLVSPIEKNGFQYKLTELLIPPIEVGAIVKNSARYLNEEYNGKKPILVIVKDGAVTFANDLRGYLNFPYDLGFIKVSSYTNGTRSNGQPSITEELVPSVADRDVVIVEDIVDTGITVELLREHIGFQKPRSLEVCTLLNKPSRRKFEVDLKFPGYYIPDKFVVGYGLDVDGLYRELAGIWVAQKLPLAI